jgi:RND superfamily putative drug exporter
METPLGRAGADAPTQTLGGDGSDAPPQTPGGRGADAPPQRLGAVANIAQWVTRHRRSVLIGWIVLLVASIGISHAVGTNFSNNFSLPGTDSQRAVDLLTRDFPAQAGDSDEIVFQTRAGQITAPAIRARITPMLAAVARLPHVTGVVSPYTSRGAHAIAANGRIAFATVNFDLRANALEKSTVQRVITVAERAASPQLQVALGGQAIEQTEAASIGAATGIGLLAAIVVLLVTFGSAIAMGLPIITALLGLGTGIGLAGLGSRLLSMPDFATELAAMIGLGVGIDYALFIVTRFRENFRGGDDVQTAITGAMDTAGRAVLFAGVTVIIALLGQFALGVAFLDGLAIASSLAVLMTMLAALTVLPALLSRFGARIGGGGSRRGRAAGRPSRLGFGRRRAATAPALGSEGGLWMRWSQLISRHPWTGAIAGLAIMLVLASPLLALRLGNSDAGNDPTSQTTRQAYDLLAKGFGPGFNGPLLLVASLPHANDPAALARIGGALAKVSDVSSVSSPRLSPHGLTAVFNVYPRSSPQSLATTELVSRLRHTSLPGIAATTSTTLLVGGVSATGIDFTHVLASKLPLFIAVVVLLSALLLLVVFRSLVIPLQAALMNLLSIGASLGVVVAIFQWGWAGSFFAVKAGPIEAFIPVMLFAIVFGLSMDYEVFLVSRIHEEWGRRRDAGEAVRHGMASTGRVVTAAATIMICVFLSFALGDQRVLKLFGLSLASAVFLDAFVVRSLLMPSVFLLLGRRTWMLPDWLERRLPHIAIDSDLHTLEPAFDEVG